MQGTDPNRLDELASLVSHFGQPRDSHHRRTADRYAPQIRIVKAMSRSAAVAPVPAGEALKPEPVVTQGLGMEPVRWVNLEDHAVRFRWLRAPATTCRQTASWSLRRLLRLTRPLTSARRSPAREGRGEITSS